MAVRRAGGRPPADRRRHLSRHLAPGAPAPNLREARAVVVATGAYDLAERARYAWRRSAACLALLPRTAFVYYRRRSWWSGARTPRPKRLSSFSASGAKPMLVHRGATLGDSIKYWVKPDIENRIKEGSVDARFNTASLKSPRRTCGSKAGRCLARVGRCGAPHDRLPIRYDATAHSRRRRGRRARRTRARPGDLRNHRPESVRHWRLRGRQAERPHLHRERPLPRRSGDQDDRGAPETDRCAASWPSGFLAFNS